MWSGVNSTSDGFTLEQELVLGNGVCKNLYFYFLDEICIYYVLNSLAAALQSHSRSETLLRAERSLG